MCRVADWTLLRLAREGAAHARPEPRARRRVSKTQTNNARQSHSAGECRWRVFKKKNDSAQILFVTLFVTIIVRLSVSASDTLQLFQRSLTSFVHLCIPSFIPAFFHSFVPLFLCSFVPSFLRSFVPSFLRSFVPSFFRSFVPSFLRSFILFLTLTLTLKSNQKTNPNLDPKLNPESQTRGGLQFILRDPKL